MLSITHTPMAAVSRKAAVLAAVVALAAVLLGTLSAPAQASHRSRVTTDVTRTVSAGQLFDMAKGYATMTSMALSACGSGPTATVTAAAANLRYALRLTPFGRVSAGWIGALYVGFTRFTGVSFCDIAYKASQGAAWAAYWGSRGGTRTRMWIQQEDRHFATDLCHTWQSFGGSWIVTDLKTSAMGGGCPRA
jgi:type IV secretory pathway TrbL component